MTTPFNLKVTFKATLITYFLFIIIGCECFPVARGVVFDEGTRKPIKNAQIQFGESKALSNDSGQFNVAGSGCDIRLTIAKYGYKSFVEKITSKNSKINIEIDDEAIYKDLDKQKYLNSDSSSFLVVRAKGINSTHFEYFGNADSFKVYLTKIEK